jgi:sulfatase-modifying factor enzyme 1
MKRHAAILAVVGLIACANVVHLVPQEKFAVTSIVATEDAKVDNSVKVEVPHKGCPNDMVDIEGDYCPNVEETCLQWVDARGRNVDAPAPGMTGRCGTWKKPTRCISKTLVKKHFCIDRFEFPNVEGERPTSWLSWYDAKRGCEALGKRLCTGSEWTFAAEGPKMQPYPYGDGYKRDSTACNFDNTYPEDKSAPVGHRPVLNVMKATSRTSPQALQLDSMLVPSGFMFDCVSPFGVYDTIGNIDEWVVNESGEPYVSELKGGHIFGVRNAARPATTIHGPTFSWYETGTRCCLSL